MVEDIAIHSEPSLCDTNITTAHALPQAFSGGPLASKVGDKLAHAGINIRSIYGGTEFGGTTTVIGDITEQKERRLEDWSWMRFSDRIKVRWVSQKNGNFECQFLVGNPKSGKWQSCSRALY